MAASRRQQFLAVAARRTSPKPAHGNARPTARHNPPNATGRYNDDDVICVCLADGFSHGIGGAKYDEVTDAILERWLGIKPPGFIVVTATLHLPLPTFPTSPLDLHKTEQMLRDLHWNPQRHLSDDALKLPIVKQLLSEKEKLIREEPEGKRERKLWFRKLADTTGRLRPFVAELLAEKQCALTKISEEANANETLVRRDFFVVPVVFLKRCWKYALPETALTPAVFSRQAGNGFH